MKQQIPRVVLVEDDDMSADYITHVLEALADFEVDRYADPLEALDDLARRPCDAVITDIHLPHIDGLEFMRRVQSEQPGVPVIVVTAFATVDLAIQAVESQAAGFLRKPFSAEDLIDRVSSQIVDARRRRPKQRVLAVGAHPDDIELGVGATLFRHYEAGDDITMLVLTRGVQGGDSDIRVSEAQAAAAMVGASLVIGDLEDTRISEGHPTVDVIERAVGSADPTVVYTHSPNDVHQDHRNAHKATLVAARRVPAIYCYQSPSATVGFSPSLFVGADAHVDNKQTLVAAHASQATTRDYMAPGLIVATARYWGRYADSDYAEPFEVVRERVALFGRLHHVAA